MEMNQYRNKFYSRHAKNLFLFERCNAVAGMSIENIPALIMSGYVYLLQKRLAGYRAQSLFLLINATFGKGSVYYGR